ncbi:MAG: transport-associated protein, partial [Pseudomonadota bacterium]
MKNKYATRLLTAAMATLIFSEATVADEKLDNDIELAAANSHVFKTWLKADNIQVEVKDGAATL